MPEELTDYINEALAELTDPTEDNQEPVEEVDEGLESDTADLAEVDDEADEDISDEGEPESDESEPDQTNSDLDLDQLVKVKVDGEELEVTLKEALAGYQRQSDYTREKQAFKREVEEFRAAAEQYAEAVGQVQALDEAWAEDPIQVLTLFTSNTENPTHAVALLIKELAGQGRLDQSFLEMFGITPDIQASWAKESEVEQLRRKANETTSRDRARLEEVEQEAAVARAIAEYDRQIDEILEAEGLDMTVRERKQFRSELASYARDNELTNLKAAYKAMKYEETKAQQKLAVKTAERAKAKKATGTVARGGSSTTGAAPVDGGETDLRSAIMAAMRENAA